MKKNVFIGVLTLLVVAGFATYYLFSNLNALVARAIEDNGSAVTETDVNVSSVDVRLRDGRASVRGMKIGSPEGFSASNVFELGDIAVALDVGSVNEDPIVLDEVRIQAPVVHAELNEKGALNLDELRQRVQNYVGSDDSGAGSSAGAQKRIRIAEFVFEQGRIEIDGSAIGIEKTTIDLPEIRLADVGGSGGAHPDQIAKIILSTFAKQAASEIARSEVQNLIEQKLGSSLADKAKGLLEKLKQ